ncbi:MAG: RNA-directed DNA polymerase [Nitrospirae bacterium]|nr:RNA-directed DNA polymerase [Nitrospirota bacterium]
MLEGRFLDSQLGDECYGARIEDGLSNSNDDSAGLYRKYHELYARWRDSGLKKAKQLLTDEQTSVCILGLDVQEYYYRIRLNIHSIAKSIYKTRPEEKNQLESAPSNLLRCLEAICVAYRKQIDPFLHLTHESVPALDTGIPIGLCSSPLLANWYLLDFDKAVKKLLRPAYYGRYVDDILLVVPAPEDLSDEESPVATFIDRVLVKAGLLNGLKDNRYEIRTPGGLYLQQGKCILQYFDAKHSIAGLEKFQDKLEKTGSDFLLMPVDEADSSLEDVAYELLYEGSINKFRSVKGMAENRYELAKHLARQTILHLLTDDPPDTEISSGLRKFFKGKNAVEFHDLWERVFTFFLIAGDTKAANIFAKHLRSEIKRVQYAEQSPITEHLISNLEEHLSLCIAISGALGDPVLQLYEDDLSVKEAFRRANLIRHHFVRVPLLNYTTYSGPLNNRVIEESIVIDPLMMELSPRYVNFDECLLLASSGDVKLKGQSSFQMACDIYEAINRRVVEDIEWNSILAKGDEADA